MSRKKIIKVVLFIVGGGVVAALLVGTYLFNKPHRNVQEAAIDFTVSSNALVDEYLGNPSAANKKYLNEEGNSKIIAVTGEVSSKTVDLKNQQVILLKSTGAKAGVSCTFMASTNKVAESLTVGQQVTIKGVIRSGASYDPDLGFYEDVIIEKCDVLK